MEKSKLVDIRKIWKKMWKNAKVVMHYHRIICILRRVRCNSPQQTNKNKNKNRKWRNQSVQMSSKLAINSASIPKNMISLSFNEAEYRRSFSAVCITSAIPFNASCINHFLFRNKQKNRNINNVAKGQFDDWLLCAISFEHQIFI